MFTSIKYVPKIIKKTESIKKIRSFGILNKFRKGVRMTKIKPAKLLIKNLGYRRIFVQKSLFINKILFITNLLFYANLIILDIKIF